MTPIIVQVPQRTPEWFQARCGLVTSTDAQAVFAKGRGGAESVTRRDLIDRLVVERRYKVPQDDGSGFVSAWMQRGIDLEGDAFAAYEADRGVVVARVGFLQHPNIRIGCSPDGVVWKPGTSQIVGGIELKVPKLSIHIGYLRGNVLPADYERQMLHHLVVSGAAWWDFVSYSPECQELPLFIVRVDAETVRGALAHHEQGVVAFLTDVDAACGAFDALVRARLPQRVSET